jgi:hypothetical protein
MAMVNSFAIPPQQYLAGAAIATTATMQTLPS